MRPFALITLFILLVCCPQDGCAALPEKLLKTVNVDSAIQLTKAYLQRPSISYKDRVLATCLLSANYCKKGDYPKARNVVLSLKWKKVQAAGMEGEVLLRRAIVEKYLFNNELAFGYFNKALLVFQQRKDKRATAKTYIELAEFHRKIVQKDLALKRLHDASVIISEIGNPPELLAHYYNRLAAVLNEESRHEESMATSRKSIAIANRIGDPYLEAVSCNELAYSMHVRDNIDSVLHYYQRAEHLFRICGALQDAILTKANRVRFHIHHAIEPENFVKWLKELEDEINQKHVPYNLREIYYYLIEQAVKRKDYKAAYEYVVKDHDLMVKEENLNTRVQVQKVREEAKDQAVRQENRMIRSELSFSQRIVWIVSVGGALVLMAFGTVMWLNWIRKKLILNLKKENDEKNVLIHEVHHRVKNNLNFVGSLLEMQMNASHSEPEIAALNDAAMRISSMSLVHEMLYTDSHSDTVQLDKYVENLIRLLVSMLEIQEGTIVEQLNVEPIIVSSRDSLSLGIIITELFTNAVKYAFSGVKNPVFSIRIFRDEKQALNVTISDNGAGFKGKPLGGGGLGVRLIDIFSRQLNGSYYIETGKGVTYSFKSKL